MYGNSYRLSNKYNSNLYLHSEADIVYFCGDISDIDNLLPRINIDNTIHGPGEAIIYFVTDFKLPLLPVCSDACLQWCIMS